MYSARSSYVTAAVETASPATVVTMLFDRLLVDVDRAAASFERQDGPDARRHVQHAQDIVAELMASLDVDVWEGGPTLMSVYTFVYRQLVEVSVSGSVEQLAECRALLAPLAETWHEAATLAAAPAPAAAPVPAAASADAGVGLLGIG